MALVLREGYEPALVTLRALSWFQVREGYLGQREAIGGSRAEPGA